MYLGELRKELAVREHDRKRRLVLNRKKRLSSLCLWFVAANVAVIVSKILASNYFVDAGVYLQNNVLGITADIGWSGWQDAFLFSCDAMFYILPVMLLVQLYIEYLVLKAENSES